MTPEFHQQAKELFLAVCELDEPARREYLDAHCGQDAALRAEVESLLPYHTTKTLITRPLKPMAPAPLAPVPADRWLPGTLVAERYRILGLLGRGGMGEVYRAEDLKLSRTVALKFMTAGRGSDPAWLARFYSEARTASTITHRHVCRIYDVGEVDGEAFISMEYIDGENLASLLRRVGRLTAEKAGQIARDLCLGLAAVHDRGVLHRDLKPANVILDGRGEVRLTDFGIAVSVGESTISERAGTPEYMAPEVWRGGPATVRSDIYSLGLILYELVTGRSAIEPKSNMASDCLPVISPPSNWVSDLDPKFERIILECLQADPRHRPESVYDVLGALPGGEVLTAMMVAGQTPPVHVVAASPTRSRRTPVIAIASAVIAVVGLAAGLLLADKTLLVSLARLSMPPEVLAHKAEEILKTLGYDPANRPSEQAFILDHDRWDAVRGTSRLTVPVGGSLPPGREVICFRYASLGPPLALSEEESVLEATWMDAPQAEVLLNGNGQLRRFEGWTSMASSTPAGRDDRQWADLFRLAGLRMSEFELRAGSSESDRRWIWESAKADPASIRVQADQQHGQMRFSVGAPLSEADRTTRPLKASGQTAISLIFVVTLIAAIPLAWNNTRQKTSDRRGAGQIAVVVFGMQFLLQILGQSVPESFIDAISWLISASKSALFLAFMVWMYYLAVEPYVRRFWPHALISWTRVLTGRFRDPLVGRDVLIGSALGVAVFVMMQLNAWVALQSSHPWSAMVGPVLDWELGRLSGYQFMASSLVNAGLHAITRGLLTLALMLVLRLVCRQRWLAASMLFLLLAATYVFALDPTGIPAWTTCALLALAAVFALNGPGFLAFLTGLLVTRLLLLAPLTLNPRDWYAGQSLLTVLILAGLIVWALSTSLKRGGSTFLSRPA